MSKIHLFVLCAISASVPSRVAHPVEPAEVGKDKTAATPLAPDYSTTALNFNAASLPEKYKGHDTFPMVIGLAKLTETKQEFETSAAFNTRKSTLLTTPILGTLTPSDEFAVQLADAAYSSRFDADKQILTVTLNFQSSFASSSIARTTLALKREVTPLGSYSGVNSFGVEKEIAKSKQVSTELHFSDFKDFKIKTDFLGADDVKVDVPLPMEAAKQLKGNLSILIRYKPGRPFVSYYHNHVDPKIDSPFEKDLHWFYLHGTVKEILFYNFSSGQIIHRWQSKRR